MPIRRRYVATIGLESAGNRTLAPCFMPRPSICCLSYLDFQGRLFDISSPVSALLPATGSQDAFVAANRLVREPATPENLQETQQSGVNVGVFTLLHHGI